MAMQWLQEWISPVDAVVWLTLGTGAGWLLRVLIEQSLQRRLATSIETLKADLVARNDAAIEAQRSSDGKLAALQAHVLSTLSSTDQHLERRKVESIEQVWEFASSRPQLRMVVHMAAGINMELALKVAAKQDSEARKLQEMAKWMLATAGIKEDGIVAGPPHPIVQRLYISDRTWATFQVLQSIRATAIMELVSMRCGADPNLLKDSKPTVDSVKSVLPQYADYLDKYGRQGALMLVDQLEEKLFSDLQGDLGVNKNDDMRARRVAAAAAAIETTRGLEFSVPDEIRSNTPPPVAAEG
jgi:hypothetical protein